MDACVARGTNNRLISAIIKVMLNRCVWAGWAKNLCIIRPLSAPVWRFLIEAAKKNVGVVTMRTMTSGVLQHEMKHLAPGIEDHCNLYEAALRFVLSDSRVHVGIVGPRWPGEILENIRIAEAWVPPYDFADVPRLTFKVYEAEQAE